MSTTQDPVTTYRARAARFDGERDRLAARSRRISFARIAAFLGALALLVRAETAGGSDAALPAVGGAALLAVFVGLVATHRRVERARRRMEELARVNREAERRHARDWAALPGEDFGVADPDHAYAVDLDLFGRASLFQLLGTATTAPGRSTLRDWLLAPAPPAEVRERQAAVAELAPMLDLRDELAVRGRLEGRSTPKELEGFLEWAEGEPWLIHRPALVWASRLIPAATLALAIAGAIGLVPGSLWLASVVVALLVSFTAGRNVHAIFGRAFSRAGAFRQYAAIFRLLAEAPFEAPRLRALQHALAAGGLPAHHRMRRLERLMELSDVRFSMLHLPIQALTLWDFHVLRALERWQLEAGRNARRWIEALGEAEALAALAALAFDNPGWTFPEIVENDAPVITAEGLGHPLLPDEVRVANDVRVGPPGTFLLVTGSNMSGKSTLLRAIGTNVVLGQAGGPVCARAMRIPPVAVYTSMRVQDSLERGVSYFMAELQRLKQVVDAAHETARAGERTLLYLLDEILHGTNSAERQVAARRVIAHLVDSGAIGAVSTHDLALADAEELTAASQPVHFSETIRRENGRTTMSFDYRLRDGVATSTNALRLMEIVGLDLEEPASSPD